jgi:pimeloyl-ACP methyl ester carboxylesterase
MVLSEMNEPVNIVAQSMGGLIALKAALAAPGKVLHMVLAATSGGLPMNSFGATDWRQGYFSNYPQAARWIGDTYEDLSERLPGIDIPTLLLWGAKDQISPVAAGEKLRDLLGNATLKIIAEGDHDLALTHAPFVGQMIATHFADAPSEPHCA